MLYWEIVETNVDKKIKCFFFKSVILESVVFKEKS